MIDSVTMGSPGGLKLRDELSAALERTKPVGSSVVLLVQEGSISMSAGALETRGVPRPRAGWWGRWRWFEAGLPALLRQAHADVCFSMTGNLSTPLTRTCGLVTTVNNMLPFTPEILAQLPRLGLTRLKMNLLKHSYLHGVRLADAVVLHSQHALEVLSHYQPRLPDKTAVVLTGAPAGISLQEGEPPPAHPNGGRPYFLYLSTMQPYKNHLRLVQAYAKASADLGDALPELVIAGIPAVPGYVATVRAAIAKVELGDRIRYVGSPPTAQIPAWIYHAHGNVFPSLCETNSVVQAEILGMHGVMACSNIPPMDEVAGDAAVLFDPRDLDSIAAVLKRLALEPALRTDLRRRSAGRFLEFSWDRCGNVIWQQAMFARERFEHRMGAPRG